MTQYGVDARLKNLQGSLVSLDILYDEMPKTSGCEKCSEINGKDQEHWCCKSQTPSMYYVEFLKVYKELSTWSLQRRQEVLFRAVANYLSNETNKGCIFYENGCTVYLTRPLNCRVYGVVPKENWNKRWEALKALQGEDFDSKPQCTLVSSEKEISPQMEDKWFEHTKKCEQRIGVPEFVINKHDEASGSYRNFHDHLLLEMLPEGTLSVLTEVKICNPDKGLIAATINALRDTLNEETSRNLQIV